MLCNANTLRCLINVRRSFINFKDFSHQYLLIRDRTFIKFVSLISQTKDITLILQKYSILKVHSLTFFDPVLLFGPVRLLVFQNFPPGTFIRNRTFIRHLRVSNLISFIKFVLTSQDVLYQSTKEIGL